MARASAWRRAIAIESAVAWFLPRKAGEGNHAKHGGGGGLFSAPPLKTPVNANSMWMWWSGSGRERRGYQARMNAVLRRTMEVHRKAE